MAISRRARAATLLATAAAAFAVALLARVHFDTFHHLAYGRDILRRGGFAAEDPFLFPLAGLPSGPQPSWLGSVLIYLAWSGLGEAGPQLLAAAVMALLFAVVLLDAADGAGTLEELALALAPVGLALAASRGRAVPRPELFAGLLLAATLLALRRLADGRRWPLLALPLGFALWANLHQSVLAGAAVVGVFVAVNGALLAAGPRGRALAEVRSPRALVLLIAAAAGGAALAGLTPVGLGPFLSPLGVIRGWIGAATPGLAGGALPAAADAAAVLKTTITELRPHALGALDPLDWLLALTGLSLVAAGRRVNLREAATAALFAALALRVQRFGPMAAVVLAPIAARHLRAGLAGLGARRRPLAARAAPAAVALLLVAAGWAAADRYRREPGLAALLPARAAEALRGADPAARLFDTFHFGGYLEWTLDRQVFQDARGNLLPADVAGAVMGPADPAAFGPLDARYRFDALVVEYPEFDAAAAAGLAASAPDQDWVADRSAWALVAFDDGGMLYVRRDGRLAALARREFPAARPAVPPGVGRPDPAALLSDLERSVTEAPACTRCRNALGYALLQGGRPAEAERELSAALAGPPLTAAQARFGLYQAARLRGDAAAAEARLREVVEAALDPAPYRRDLAVLLAQAGRPREGLAEIQKNLAAHPREPVDLQLAAELARAAGDAR